MNELNYNNDTEGIVEFPLTPKEKNLVDEVFSKFVVKVKDNYPEPLALGVISEILGEIEVKAHPKWVLKNIIKTKNVTNLNGIIQFVYDVDDEIIEEKGGENMDSVIRDFSNKMTSGEEKVAKAVIDHFKEGFKIKNPSRAVFENCLSTAFPKIKNGKVATTNLINKGWLEEVDGKIFLGPKGEKYLSP